MEKIKLICEQFAERCRYTVWVGGVEVNDHMLTRGEADRLAAEYEADGYDDVVVERGYI